MYNLILLSIGKYVCTHLYVNNNMHGERLVFIYVYQD